jgi:hypothetical protein
MQVYIPGWFTLALINAALANADGRSPLIYFLASVILGPFITVVLAATKEGPGRRLRQVDLIRGDRQQTQ